MNFLFLRQDAKRLIARPYEERHYDIASLTLERRVQGSEAVELLLQESSKVHVKEGGQNPRRNFLSFVTMPHLRRATNLLFAIAGTLILQRKVKNTDEQ